MLSKLAYFAGCLALFSVVGVVVLFGLMFLAMSGVFIEGLLRDIADTEVRFDTYLAAVGVCSIPLLYYFHKMGQAELGENSGFDLFEVTETGALSNLPFIFGMCFGLSFAILFFIPNVVFMSFGVSHFSGRCDVDCQFWFFFENFLKVALFDFLEIFEISISEIQPTTTAGRTIVFMYRVLIGYTVLYYLILAYKSAEISSKQ